MVRRRPTNKNYIALALSPRADKQMTARGQLADPIGGVYWKGMPLIRTLLGFRRAIGSLKPISGLKVAPLYRTITNMQ